VIPEFRIGRKAVIYVIEAAFSEIMNMIIGIAIMPTTRCRRLLFLMIVCCATSSLPSSDPGSGWHPQCEQVKRILIVTAFSM
jgi:hypothetical protein